MAEVIPWGIDTRRFPFFARRRKPTRLLYVGQIMPHKGVNAAIEALKWIRVKKECEMVRLTIAGGTILPDYETSLRKLVLELGLENHVHFTGFVPHEELPEIYRQHDILIFPSVWDEPFGIALLEAMSSGLAVVATATGGSAEIIKDEENAMVFPPGDAQACAHQIQRLSHDFTLFQRLVRAARRKVEEAFRFETTLDRIEDSLSRNAKCRRTL
jgi:glycosyltransferase involved in cell wall biosynthesis